MERSTLSEESPQGEKNSAETAASDRDNTSRPRESISRDSDAYCFQTINMQMPCIGRGLFICGSSAVRNVALLKLQNITHVLNLARELEGIELPDFVNVRFVALRDSEAEDLLPCLPGLVEHIHHVISNGGRIVVNCMAGVSRSASVCLAYKVRHEGLSLHEAYDEVFAARPVIAPNLAFWRALIQWEMEVRGQNSVVMKPFICGMVPELVPYERYTEMRIKFGWMEELLTMWTFHLLLFLLQVISLVWV